MRRIQESSPHERLRDDPRFLYGKQTSAEALLLANFSAAGLKAPDDLDWLDGRGDELGCAYRNCPFSLKNMRTTGLSPGVWALDPLFSNPHNPICCPRHLMVADYLTSKACMVSRGSLPSPS